MRCVKLMLLFVSVPCMAGIGMQEPTTPPTESCSLFLDSSLPEPLLPFGYKWASKTSLDSTSLLSGSCSYSPETCASSGPNAGTINEVTGRLSPILRADAQLQDARAILLNAVWMYLLGHQSTLNNGAVLSPCSAVGSCTADWARSIAQLAVTGRQAYNSFATWNPSEVALAGGPQLPDLLALINGGYINISGSNEASINIPALPGNFTAAQATAAASFVLQESYRALWAIRSNNPTWRQYRFANLGWIATSGEDDTPQRPVNVPTAPFRQFETSVPVSVGGQTLLLTARYMIATKRSQINLPMLHLCDNPLPSSGCTIPQPLATAPVVPTVLGRCVPSGIGRPPQPPMRCQALLTLPKDDDPTQMFKGDDSLPNHYVFIYIPGGGSRLEEATAMAQHFLNDFSTMSSDIAVISLDLPNSAYSDQWLYSSTGAPRIPLDPAMNFEDAPAGNIFNYPILNFTLNYVNNFILNLIQKGIIGKDKVSVVMGGSLGANLSLLLSMNKPVNSPWAPFNTAISLTSPASYLHNVVAWSPTTMVSYLVSAKGLLGIVNNTMTGGDWAWTPSETGSTRANYFWNLYYQPTAPIPVFGGSLNGLPPDPEMWYRADWNDQSGNASCKASKIEQTRFDRYEVYSTLMRRWTRASDIEQAIFAMDANSDSTGATYAPNYMNITSRLLLAAGESDNFSNLSGVIGNYQDIFGFTHDVANDMAAATGRTLFLKDTGHSIHDERPTFLAGQIVAFLTSPPNNIDLTLTTGNDNVRWNSTVQLIIGLNPGLNPPIPGPLIFNLNTWLFPWPPGPIGPCNNPSCTGLNAFGFANNSVHSFTLALPYNVTPAMINSFTVAFASGADCQANFGAVLNGCVNYTDNWDLNAVVACSQGSAFVNDAISASTTQCDDGSVCLNRFKGNATFSPPSFRVPTGSGTSPACNISVHNNPPPSRDVPRTVFSGGPN